MCTSEMSLLSSSAKSGYDVLTPSLSYTPAYLQMLRRRDVPPMVRPTQDSHAAANRSDEDAGKVGKLVILPGGDEGRPLGALVTLFAEHGSYWSKDEKLEFMNLHGIDASVVSLANPWLDFLPLEEAKQYAFTINEELEAYCQAPTTIASSFNSSLDTRILAFGVLPLSSIHTLSSQESVKAVVETIAQVSNLSCMRGVIIGTRGLGKGLDDPVMDAIFQALQDSELVIFLHPHYGITPARGASSEFGEIDNGHVLPLALGFPMETTIAVSRMILSGVMDRFPSLKILLAHSAGALPMLSSRLASCIAHDPIVRDRLQHDARAYLGRFYYDAVTYGADELTFLERCIARAEAYEGTEDSLPFVDRVNNRFEKVEEMSNLASSSGENLGIDRIMFGTDHPFFPAAKGERWRSVDENLFAIQYARGWSNEDRARVLGKNAVKLFRFS